MGALQHLKGWWITDDPDDVARSRHDRDLAVEELAGIEATVAYLWGEVQEIVERCREHLAMVQHYREGWIERTPFVEYEDWAPDQLGLPRVG
ncbi:MAG: hypothetical protein ACXWCM_07365 [Acidimicrobiales bacterium]